MPEGDTIWRTAGRLRPALVGFKVQKMRLPRAIGTDGVEPGTTIDSVVAKGKYLLISFSDGQVLESHMKMTGAWHLYKVGENWRKSPTTARAVIQVDSGWVAVCFSAPHVELRATAQDGNHFHLGPNLCEPDADLDECVKRMETHVDPNSPIGVVMLDQRVFCGVGNVYKSEVLFACKVSPFVPVSDVPADTRRQIVEMCHRLLRVNLGAGPRKTMMGGLGVYGKRGEPCPRCSTQIERAVQGEHVRSTYWCPECQPSELTI